VLESEESAVLILEELDANRVQGGSSCAAAKIAIVNSLGVFRLMDCFAILGADEQVIIIFVKVYDSEPMNPWIPGLFLDHCIDNIFPTGVAMGVADSVVEHRVMNFPNFIAIGSKVD
jgi:hypothetical protein